MGGEKPKALCQLNGRPLISYLVESVKKSGICPQPVIVVCDEHTLVQDILGADCDYVVQAEQLGTGHAVACAEEFLKNKAEHILVLYSDHPFLIPSTLQQLKDRHLGQKKVLTLMTTRISDFADWRAAFTSFGRIIRDPQGKIIEIVENKDATEEQRQILEVNPMYCCFKADWLWKNLKKIDNKNAQSEYYLTDLIRTAFLEGQEIESLPIENWECLGVNRPEELAAAEKFLKENLSFL